MRGHVTRFFDDAFTEKAKRQTMSKVILITGASSGMGKEAAILLATQGHKVYAGARRLERLQELEPYGVVPVEMDVTNEENNERAVDQIIEKEGRIDVLINNAGYGLYGPVEEIPMADARYQLDVNLFGLAHLTQQVLPHMRKQGSGRIINTSSMGGRIFTPLGAWYHATKHALEGWSDCLRLETKPFDIQVVVIQPGGIKTEFGEVLFKQMEKYYDTSAYKSQMEPFKRMMSDPKMLERGTEPAVLAKVFAKAVNAKKPKRRYVKGFGARPMMFVRKWFGDGMYEWMIKRAFR